MEIVPCSKAYFNNVGLIAGNTQRCVLTIEVIPVFYNYCWFEYIKHVIFQVKNKQIKSDFAKMNFYFSIVLIMSVLLNFK